MTAIAGSSGGLGEIATLSWRQPSPGGGPPIAPVRGTATGRVVLHTTPSRLRVDSTAARQEAGYHTITGLARAGSQYSARVARRNVAQTVADGYRLAAIDQGGNAIAQIAFEQTLADLRTHQYGLAFIPRTPPSIDYTPGTLSIDVVY